MRTIYIINVYAYQTHNSECKWYKLTTVRGYGSSVTFTFVTTLIYVKLPAAATSLSLFVSKCLVICTSLSSRPVNLRPPRRKRLASLLLGAPLLLGVTHLRRIRTP